MLMNNVNLQWTRFRNIQALNNPRQIHMSLKSMKQSIFFLLFLKYKSLNLFFVFFFY